MQSIVDGGSPQGQGHRITENPKKCPQCGRYFDGTRNGHIFLDGLPNRAQDRACDYREFDQPIIKLMPPEVTALNRIFDNNLFEGVKFSEIPEVRRICRRRNVDPVMAEDYCSEARAILLSRDLPIRHEGYEKTGQHPANPEIKDAKLLLAATYYAGDRVALTLFANGRPVPNCTWTKTSAQVQEIVTQNGWRKVDQFARARAGGAS